MSSEEIVKKNSTNSKKPQNSKHESLKEFLVLADENGEKITLDDAGIDNLISKDETELNDEERIFLYEKAMSFKGLGSNCLLYTSPSPRDKRQSRMPSSA